MTSLKVNIQLYDRIRELTEKFIMNNQRIFGETLTKAQINTYVSVYSNKFLLLVFDQTSPSFKDYLELLTTDPSPKDWDEEWVRDFMDTENVDLLERFPQEGDQTLEMSLQTLEIGTQSQEDYDAETEDEDENRYSAQTVIDHRLYKQ